MNKKPHNTLLISLALNGYHLLYKQHLKTHEAYAKSMGYDYVLVDKPYISGLGVECCWLKISLILSAFENGYTNVVYLDADAKVRPNAPDITKQMSAAEDIYLARGYSGEFNSGVILCRNSVAAKEFFLNVLGKANTPYTKDCTVGWGENGRIIEQARKTNCIGELDLKWNNTFDANCCDHIRHFSHGPLRTNALLVLTHKITMRYSRLLNKISTAPKSVRLAVEMNKIRNVYRCFSGSTCQHQS